MNTEFTPEEQDILIAIISENYLKGIPAHIIAKLTTDTIHQFDNYHEEVTSNIKNKLPLQLSDICYLILKLKLLPSTEVNNLLLTKLFYMKSLLTNESH
jgi:F0F1-type ATP synthase alpha subunit